MSSMYERILDVIERIGPTTIFSIHEEINNLPSEQLQENRPVPLSSIKSAITRKKDLFYVDNNIVSILPDKEIKKLIIEYQNHDSCWYKFTIDFMKETYIFQEWHRSANKQTLPFGKRVVDNDYLALKKEIYKLKIWDLELSAPYESLPSWTFTLQTVEKDYVIKGIDTKEKNWKKIEKVISPFMDIQSIISK
ncbi:hypothetical protein [Niallia sp. 01092]|uniref:hypothetical protein n=1 Tax=unclassified Niallia TaxID=2837522 RepID=UPI003FD3B94E